MLFSILVRKKVLMSRENPGNSHRRQSRTAFNHAVTLPFPTAAD
jgi:hypothetical protein